GFHAQEQTGEVAGPLTVVLLPEKQQFAQQMDATQSMAILVLKIAGPSIMHTGALKLGSNPNRIQSLLASAGMSRVMGQRWRAAGMHPPALASDIQPGFILVQDRRVNERLFDLGFHWLQFFGGTSLHRGQGCLRERHAQQISAQLGSSGLWQQLVDLQIHRDGRNPRTILDGSVDRWGKGCVREPLAARTALP